MPVLPSARLAPSPATMSLTISARVDNVPNHANTRNTVQWNCG
jgi:hypothetical protein